MTIKDKTIAGAGWNGAGNIARQLIQVINLIVMARILSPDDFGIYALLMFFVSFMMLLGNMGTTSVIIHLSHASQELLSSIFYFNIAIGCILCLALSLSSNLIAEFFDQPDAGVLFQIISVMFVIASFSLVQRALLEKEMFFKQVVLIETAAQISGLLLGISMAVIGAGVYSLVFMALMNSFVLTIGFWLSTSWRPSVCFSIKHIKKVWFYSSNLTGFNLINFAARNMDTFLVARILGSSPLGLYNIAYRVMLYPIQNIALTLIRVLFPAFSKIKNDNLKFKHSYLESLSYIALITFPAMLGLMSVSDNFVLAFFGGSWIEVANLLTVMAPIGLIHSIVTTAGVIYSVKGTTNVLLVLGVVNTTVTTALMIIGIIYYGLFGLVVFYLIAHILMFFPNLYFSWRQINLGVYEGLYTLFPFLFASVIMGVLVYCLGLWLDAYLIGVHARLAIQVMSGALIYVAAIFIFLPRRIYNMVCRIID